MYGNKCNIERSECGTNCGEADYAKALSEWARVELLKEKVKARIAKEYGAKLDKIADLIAEVVAERTKTQKELEKTHGELKSAFEEFYGEADS